MGFEVFSCRSDFIARQSRSVISLFVFSIHFLVLGALGGATGSISFSTLGNSVGNIEGSSVNGLFSAVLSLVEVCACTGELERSAGGSVCMFKALFLRGTNLMGCSSSMGFLVGSLITIRNQGLKHEQLGGNLKLGKKYIGSICFVVLGGAINVGTNLYTHTSNTHTLFRFRWVGSLCVFTFGLTLN